MATWINVLTPDGPVLAPVTDPRQRAKAARHLNAIRRYVELGDASRLARFEGAFIETDDGRRLQLVTDLATIDRLAEGGEIHFELYRS